MSRALCDDRNSPDSLFAKGMTSASGEVARNAGAKLRRHQRLRYLLSHEMALVWSNGLLSCQSTIFSEQSGANTHAPVEQSAKRLA